MKDQEAIQLFTDLLQNRNVSIGADNSTIGTTTVKYPYFIPARYVVAANQYAQDGFSKEMMSGVYSYIANNMKFYDYVQGIKETGFVAPLYDDDEPVAATIEPDLTDDIHRSEVVVENPWPSTNDVVDIEEKQAVLPEASPEALPEYDTLGEFKPTVYSFEPIFVPEPMPNPFIEELKKMEIEEDNNVTPEQDDAYTALPAEEPVILPEAVVETVPAPLFDDSFEIDAFELDEAPLPQLFVYPERTAEKDLSDEYVFESIDDTGAIKDIVEKNEEPEMAGLTGSTDEETDMASETPIPATEPAKPATELNSILDEVKQYLVERSDSDVTIDYYLKPTPPPTPWNLSEIQEAALETPVVATSATVPVEPLSITGAPDDAHATESVTVAGEPLTATAKPFMEQDSTTALPADAPAVDDIYTPAFSEDYFLQQGIKIPNELPEDAAAIQSPKHTETAREKRDRSLMVVMSFPEWLLHFKYSAEKEQEEQEDKKAVKAMWQREKLAAALEEEDEEIPENVFEMAVNSITKEEGLASESLANIYIKQQKYDKAIAMYRKLSLQNPEKNAYFAHKIEEVLKYKQI